MKTNNQKIGTQGEQIAKEYVQKKGYRILEQNWRWRKAEIDLIAFHGDILVFIEVKTRTYNLYGPPELSVTKRKEQLFADAASVYMEQIDHTWEIRFDIITVIMKASSNHFIEHFEDTFFPGL